MICVKTILGLGRFSGGNSIGFVEEAAEVNALSVYSDFGYPESAIFAATHTNKSRFIIGSNGGVFGVDRLVRRSQIANPVIRRITIYMVNTAVRPRAVINGIGNPVSQISFPKYPALNVPVLVWAGERWLSCKHLVPSLSASLSFVVGAVGREYPYRPRLPSQFTGLVIIMKQAAQKLRRGLFYHAKY